MKATVIDVTKVSQLKLPKSQSVYIEPYGVTSEVFNKEQITAELHDMAENKVVALEYKGDSFKIRNMMSRVIVVNLNIKKQEEIKQSESKTQEVTNVEKTNSRSKK